VLFLWQTPLLIDEATGLVNPITGEETDDSMESGKIAAEHFIYMFARRNFSYTSLVAFDTALRQHLFIFCDRLRFFYLDAFVVNMLVRAIAQNEELMKLFLDMALNNRNIFRGVGS
jgi:flavin-dependent dehydrogenase